jgi:hypothetical protein
MIKFDIKFTAKTSLQNIRQVQSQIKNLPQEAFQFFKDNTPIDTGNARRNTTLNNNRIVANYDYAEVLDKGRHMTNKGMRGSKQAPKGMSKPTADFIRRRLKQITGR